MPGIPGYQADLEPYPFDLAAGSQGAHDDGPGRHGRLHARLTSAS
jgi:hypothetical protein